MVDNNNDKNEYIRKDRIPLCMILHNYFAKILVVTGSIEVIPLPTIKCLKITSRFGLGK